MRKLRWMQWLKKLKQQKLMKWLKTTLMLKNKNQEANIMKYLLICIIMIMSSCQTKEEIISKKITGQWDIYKFKYKNKNCIEDLLINSITFRKDKKFLIPEIYEHPAEDEEDNAKWEVQIDSVENVKLKMNCKNSIFNNSYQVKFFRNYEKRLLCIELKSGTTYIKAYKALQNFDYNGRDW